MVPLVKVLVIGIANPLLIGIYNENNTLIESYTEDGYASDVLAKVFEKILSSYTIGELLYVNGPGSFMAIKISYVFLKTLSICNKIPLLATDGFSFNNNTPIKAIGNKVFVKINDAIELQTKTTQSIGSFTLPLILDMRQFTQDCTPKYYLPAV